MAEIVPDPEPITKTPVDPPEGGGFFSRELGKILPHAEHAEADVAHLAGDISSELAAHRQDILAAASDAVDILKLVDPADAALASAAGALVPKLLAMAEHAAAITRAALGGSLAAPAG